MEVHLPLIPGRRCNPFLNVFASCPLSTLYSHFGWVCLLSLVDAVLPFRKCLPFVTCRHCMLIFSVSVNAWLLRYTNRILIESMICPTTFQSQWSLNLTALLTKRCTIIADKYVICRYLYESWKRFMRIFELYKYSKYFLYTILSESRCSVYFFHTIGKIQPLKKIKFNTYNLKKNAYTVSLDRNTLNRSSNCALQKINIFFFKKCSVLIFKNMWDIKIYIKVYGRVNTTRQARKRANQQNARANLALQ